MQKKYRIVEGPESVQGSNEWRAFRRGKMTASMAGSVMGIDPWRTPLQLFNEWVLEESKTETEAMRRGTRLEPVARDLINSRTKRFYKPVVLQSLINPQFMVSLDGYWEDEEGSPFIIEIKCPNEKTHNNAGKGKVELHYYMQMQMQMDIVGVDQMTYISFDGVKDIHTVEVERDDEVCKDLYQRQLNFIESVNEFRPPAPTEDDWVENKNEDLFLLAHQSRNLADQEKEIKKKREEIKEMMQPFLTSEKMKVGDIKIQKIVTEGRIDYSRVPELEGLDLEKYRGPSIISWRVQ